SAWTCKTTNSEISASSQDFLIALLRLHGSCLDGLQNDKGQADRQALKRVSVGSAASVSSWHPFLAAWNVARHRATRFLALRPRVPRRPASPCAPAPRRATSGHANPAAPDRN